MNKFHYILPLSLLFSCGQNSNEMLQNLKVDKSAASTTEYAALEEADASTPKQTTEEVNTNSIKESTVKKIIRSGNITIESKDLKKTKETLDLLVKKTDAYYEQESTSSGSTYTNYTLTVRIPSSRFDNFLRSVEKGEDKVTEKSIQAQDVSLQYYDLESRSKSKRAYLERYQNMVSSAKNVKELLEIEEQIRQLQEEIESTESTLRTLKDQVGYSSLQIQIYNSDSLSAHGESGFWLKIKDAFAFGWELIANIFIAMIGIWPIILLAIVTFLGWKKYKRNKKNSST